MNDFPGIEGSADNIESETLIIVEHEWERTGGPLIDDVEDGRRTLSQAAGRFTDFYGAEPDDWKAYILTIISDRGGDPEDIIAQDVEAEDRPEEDE